ncbi:spore germination protein [Sinanaerobacter sp. ZZT-01]|uniref:spore germination protein n=1 Tax=Sinanaerobacter sp. ZZT-01 TaxID=3111540 RepID=UPI002D7A028E|nr:spore germination protein [Sinanaerobacter sp. ZZT-01]WRR92911.1 spore germination protein [Sinanaerobacter sp. ZZT-01]
MNFLFKKNYNTKEKSRTAAAGQSSAAFDENVSLSLDDNITKFHKIFGEDTTIKFRKFQNQKNPKIRCCILFVDGMIDNILINEHIIEPIMLNQHLHDKDNLLKTFEEKVLFSNEVIKSNQMTKLISELLSGNTILLIDGCSYGLSLSTKGWPVRSIAEPTAEKVLSGPREGFTETIIVNLSMIRRKICSPDLKFEFMSIGKQTQTKVALCYIDGIANENVLKNIRKRLKSISIDGILDTNYVEELIKDAPRSPFKTTGSTERPDIVAAKLLEGRVALVVDGTPVVLTAPFFFIEYFQSNDDYYTNFYVGTFGRWLRMLGFFTTLSLPAIYLALVTFHPDLLPTRFLLNLSESRLELPFPTLFEMILLIFSFELILEGGSKVPDNFGQTLSILGGLVLGQAAVDAKLVSIPVVIIIAFTGVTGIMIPHLKSPAILFRILWLILASILGFPGYILGMIGVMIHLCSIESFGFPYMSSLSTSFPQKCQDTFIRSPWYKMKLRPSYISPYNRKRQRSQI